MRSVLWHYLMCCVLLFELSNFFFSLFSTTYLQGFDGKNLAIIMHCFLHVSRFLIANANRYKWLIVILLFVLYRTFLCSTLVNISTRIFHLPFYKLNYLKSQWRINYVSQTSMACLYELLCWRATNKNNNFQTYHYLTCSIIKNQLDIAKAYNGTWNICKKPTLSSYLEPWPLIALYLSRHFSSSFTFKSLSLQCPFSARWKLISFLKI